MDNTYVFSVIKISMITTCWIESTSSYDGIWYRVWIDKGPRLNCWNVDKRRQRRCKIGRNVKHIDIIYIYTQFPLQWLCWLRLANRNPLRDLMLKPAGHWMDPYFHILIHCNSLMGGGVGGGGGGGLSSGERTGRVLQAISSVMNPPILVALVDTVRSFFKPKSVSWIICSIWNGECHQVSAFHRKL